MRSDYNRDLNDCSPKSNPFDSRCIRKGNVKDILTLVNTIIPVPFGDNTTVECQKVEFKQFDNGTFWLHYQTGTGAEFTGTLSAGEGETWLNDLLSVLLGSTRN